MNLFDFCHHCFHVALTCIQFFKNIITEIFPLNSELRLKVYLKLLQFDFRKLE